MKKTADVIIIGGGINGCATAYYLAKRGIKDVLVLEADDSIGHGGSSRNGDFYMVSYRDPNLEKTNDIYEGAADYIRNFDVSRRDMVKFIIGTIGEIDAPLTPSAIGSRSFTHYMCNCTEDMLRKDREEVLDATVESIRELAPLIESAVGQNYLCVVGNQKQINEAADLFDEIKPLIG